MRKGLMLILLLAALAVPALCACAEEAAPAGTEAEEAEWTGMFYFCGSDLESKYGFASGNLEEIAQVSYPDTMISAYPLFRGQAIDTDNIPYPPNVNVLIETGGTTRWHDDNLSIDIRTDVLHSRNDAAMLCPGFFKSRLLCSRLRPGVYQRRSAGELKTPPHGKHCSPAVTVRRDNRRHVRRPDIA